MRLNENQSERIRIIEHPKQQQRSSDMKRCIRAYVIIVERFNQTKNTDFIMLLHEILRNGSPLILDSKKHAASKNGIWPSELLTAIIVA